jgi:hypothetical protein
MGRAERVVYVKVGQFGELLGKFGVVLLLFLVEPKVLKE